MNFMQINGKTLDTGTFLAYIYPGNQIAFNMKKLIIVLCLALFGAVAASAQAVYAVQYKSDADVKVYVTNYKSDADLVVYKCQYKSDADGNKGLWHFVNYKSDAKKKIFFVQYKSDADIVIYFCDYKSDAGWRNNSKMHYMY